MKQYKWNKQTTIYPTYNEITSGNIIKSYKYSYALLSCIVIIIVFVLIHKIE